MDLSASNPAVAAAYLAFAEIAPWLLLTGAYQPPGAPHDPASAQAAVVQLLALANKGGVVRVDPTSAPVVRLVGSNAARGGTGTVAAPGAPATGVPYLTEVFYKWQEAAKSWSPSGSSGVGGGWTPSGPNIPACVVRAPYWSFAPPAVTTSDEARAALALLRGTVAGAGQGDSIAARFGSAALAERAVATSLANAVALNLHAEGAGDADHAGANGQLALRQAVQRVRWLAGETGPDDLLAESLGGPVNQDDPVPLGTVALNAVEDHWPWLVAGGVIVAGAAYALHRVAGEGRRTRVNALSTADVKRLFHEYARRERAPGADYLRSMSDEALWMNRVYSDPAIQDEIARRPHLRLRRERELAADRER
jgi:hypothetical protein